MGIAANNIPDWYNKEEVECFEKIRELARSLPSATDILVEHEGSIEVILELKRSASEEEIGKISDFNRGMHELFIEFVYQNEKVKGKRYGLS